MRWSLMALSGNRGTAVFCPLLDKSGQATAHAKIELMMGPTGIAKS